MKQSWFERHMSDDCPYGNLLMFSVWSWHLNRSCCVLICRDSKCYKCMRWIIRKSVNYRGGTRYKSCWLEAGCISKTICKLNTWYFRGPMMAVLDSCNVKTWHGRFNYQSQAESALNWSWWTQIHKIGGGWPYPVKEPVKFITCFSCDIDIQYCCIFKPMKNQLENSRCRTSLVFSSTLHYFRMSSL